MRKAGKGPAPSSPSPAHPRRMRGQMTRGPGVEEVRWAGAESRCVNRPMGHTARGMQQGTYSNSLWRLGLLGKDCATDVQFMFMTKLFN